MTTGLSKLWLPRVRKFATWSRNEQFILIEASLFLGLARLAIMVLPFRRIAPYLGQHMAVSSEAIDQENLTELRSIARAIDTASRHLPWECKCLTQAMAARVMLRRRRIPCTLYLGLAKDQNRNLQAHAWVRSGRLILTGRNGMEAYTVVATFA
ncbi:MAG: lasso peptide biosynthesis B2 protein [Deltaproteobacteria bacterium]|nr:lasso peptide biosynthesis B2 protein [Deltaproteobacteria bacterium]